MFGQYEINDELYRTAFGRVCTATRIGATVSQSAPVTPAISHSSTSGPHSPLQALADECVERLDEFRAPPSEAELARRRRAQLTEAQEAMLVRFGYPYVLNTWFFHMTLTRRLSATEHTTWRPQVERFFEHAVATQRMVTDICLFTQAGPGAPFVIEERVALAG